ncbi:hypothetical protein DYB32_010207 [Aphanomyces invadans]|uniref:Uncharacterized protein n=1 Tax=Aphanomyces invadans TaxID=157072 RepID=A0A3R6YXP4_9STRA|nr:hypothetical protein DYB32_010207 [Aphanomyces invadans]
MMKMSMHTIQDVDNETSDGDADDLTKLCDDEPFLNLFLGSFIRYDSTTSSNQTRLPGSKRSLKLDMTGAQRIYNGIFHYYLTLLDPFNVVGMSKAQFRVLLKDAGLLPNPGGAPGSTPPPLKLHAADMIFTLLATPDTRPDAPSKESMMLISGFYKAMVNVGERAVAGLDEKVEAAIEDVDAWFCTEYMYKDIEAKMASNPQVVALVAGNRVQLQTLHRFYSSDSRFKLMTFQTLSQLATDFALTPTLLCSTSALYHVCEAINWINGHSYTVVISFEKFVQICRTLAVLFPQDGAAGELSCWQAFLTFLNTHRHNRATTLGTNPLNFVPFAINLEQVPAVVQPALLPPPIEQDEDDPGDDM